MRVLYLAIGGKGEVAIGRSLLQGRCQERGRHWGKLASGGSRDREIAPTGEVSGERGRHWGKHQEEVAIGRSLLQGRCQERESPLGEVGIYGGSRDREIAPTGEVSGESRHWGKLAFMEKSRSGDRSYRGGVRREVAIGGSWHSWRSRDREIAPTGEVSGESRHWGKSRSGDRSYRGGVRRESRHWGKHHGGKSRSGDRSYRKLDKKTYIKV